MAGIYIHIPFCKSKCSYCDFYSCTSLTLRDRVVKSIEEELESEYDFLGNVPVETIYFGGGTPSLCDPSQIGMLIGIVGRLWDCSGLIEITVEANPDDLTTDYLKKLAATGVNRLSIGIQSFNDRDLRLMNRRHTASGAENAVNNARKAGFENITIDLIYGIPGTSVDDLELTLGKAISLNVEHISAYHLTVEQNTPLWRQVEQGKLSPVDEQQSEEQYLAVHRALTAAGFEHYEISNFARPGYRARHNNAYWKGSPYLGVGPSAHSFDGHRRRWSSPSITEYLSQERVSYRVETLTPEDRFNEYVMTNLRCAEGASYDEIRTLFGAEKAEEFVRRASTHIARGLLCFQSGRYVIPPEKYLISDVVISDLFIG